jgi:hypothetical protein
MSENIFEAEVIGIMAGGDIITNMGICEVSATLKNYDPPQPGDGVLIIKLDNGQQMIITGTGYDRLPE